MNIRDLFVPFEDELQLLPSKRVPAPPLIEWTSAFGDFFFREKGADPQILWCDLAYIVTPKRPLPPARRATLAKRVSRAFNGRTFFRVVPIEEDWLLVRPKRALVKSPLQDTGAWWRWYADFQAPSTQIAWLSQPQAWFLEQLASWRKDKDLDCAREIARLSDEERKWAPMLASEEKRTRWLQLACALELLATPADESSWWFVWPRAYNEGSRAAIQVAHSNIIQSSNATARLLEAVLGKHLTIMWDENRERGAISGIRRQQRSHIPFFAENPSQHERLEALLLWRDFARDIGKQDEIEPLLRELMG